MATLYQNPSLNEGAGQRSAPEFPDTKVPPKAQPVFTEVSVNGVTIPEEYILAEAQNHPAETPGAALLEAAKALVVRELLAQEATRQNLHGEPQADAGGHMETARDAAIRTLIDKEVEVPLSGGAERKRFYDQNRGKFESETLFEARHILIAADPSDKVARNAARAKAEEINTILASKPGALEELAQMHSDCPSKATGGNLGQLGRGATVAEFEAALGRMEEGTITGAPVESRFGFHIISLDRKIDGKSLPFEMVEEKIGAWLEASAWSRAVSQYIAILAGRASITGIAFDGSESPLVQ